MRHVGKAGDRRLYGHMIAFHRAATAVMAMIVDPPECLWNVVGLRGTILSDVKLSDHAARSIG